MTNAIRILRKQYPDVGIVGKVYGPWSVGYAMAGIENILALRGDPPAGEGRFVPVEGGLAHADELAALVAEHYPVCVAGACYPEIHPEADSLDADLANLRRKVDAGVSVLITQLFFDNRAYDRFVSEARAHGIEVPIIPGIMPIANFTQLARFSDACGAEIPRWIRQKLQSFGDDRASIRSFGLDVVTDLCDRLLSQDAPGLHFYTLNMAGLTTTIWQRLGL